MQHLYKSHPTNTPGPTSKRYPETCEAAADLLGVVPAGGSFGEPGVLSYGDWEEKVCCALEFWSCLRLENKEGLDVLFVSPLKN